MTDGFWWNCQNEWITQCKVLQCYNTCFINRNMPTYAPQCTHTPLKHQQEIYANVQYGLFIEISFNSCDLRHKVSTKSKVTAYIKLFVSDVGVKETAMSIAAHACCLYTCAMRGFKAKSPNLQVAIFINSRTPLWFEKLKAGHQHFKCLWE